MKTSYIIAGAYYTHSLGFLDTFFEVIRVTYRGTKFTKAKVKWFNRGGPGETPWPLGITETVRIPHSIYWTRLNNNANITPWSIKK